MRFQKILLAIGAVAVTVAGYRAYGWAGVAFATAALVMWGLLHVNRVIHVFRRASQRPVGFIGSAVMLHAKLKPGVSLLHVLALTRALGEQLSAQDAQPEIYRWTDASESSVTCEFERGRLVRWELKRPTQDVADDGVQANAPRALSPAP